MANQWEYKYVNGPSREDELNQLGAQGWELAGVINDTSGGVSTYSLPYSAQQSTVGTTFTKAILIFKRHVQ